MHYTPYPLANPHLPPLFPDSQAIAHDVEVECSDTVIIERLHWHSSGPEAERVCRLGKDPTQPEGGVVSQVPTIHTHTHTHRQTHTHRHTHKHTHVGSSKQTEGVQELPASSSDTVFIITIIDMGLNVSLWWQMKWMLVEIRDVTFILKATSWLLFEKNFRANWPEGWRLTPPCWELALSHPKHCIVWISELLTSELRGVTDY